MILTGAYNSNVHCIDIKNQTNCQFDVEFLDKRGKNVGQYKSYKGRKLVVLSDEKNQQEQHKLNIP